MNLVAELLMFILNGNSGGKCGLLIAGAEWFWDVDWKKRLGAPGEKMVLARPHNETSFVRLGLKSPSDIVSPC
jgi:hypothetical protein